MTIARIEDLLTRFHDEVFIYIDDDHQGDPLILDPLWSEVGPFSPGETSEAIAHLGEVMNDPWTSLQRRKTAGSLLNYLLEDLDRQGLPADELLAVLVTTFGDRTYPVGLRLTAVQCAPTASPWSAALDETLRAVLLDATEPRQIRGRAAFVLGAAPQPTREAIDAMATLIRDAEQPLPLRHELASVLARTGDAHALDVLVDIVATPLAHADVLAATLAALPFANIGRAGDGATFRRALTALRDLAADRTQAVTTRVQAVKQLGWVIDRDDAILGDLERLLTDPTLPVALLSAAIRAYTNHVDNGAVDFTSLARIVRDPRLPATLRSEALEALRVYAADVVQFPEFVVVMHGVTRQPVDHATRAWVSLLFAQLLRSAEETTSLRTDAAYKLKRLRGVHTPVFVEVFLDDDAPDALRSLVAAFLAEDIAALRDAPAARWLAVCDALLDRLGATTREGRCAAKLRDALLRDTPPDAPATDA